ncbi:MAG: diaminohydroxyphosphoribosylaminopyrimidine deaminase [Verrucomicrobiales bacterium]
MITDESLDIEMMRLALREAAKGVGLTSPNPPVGCIIAKGDRILGKGWHRRAGLPHAEREAIACVNETHGTKAARLLRQSTLYVTLEPCSTEGRTPPCTTGIIAAGIPRVVYATTDPSPHHRGKGADQLRAQSIDVTADVLSEQAQVILRPFTKLIQTGMPWVIAKAAISLDGRITRPVGESQWLTSEKARADAQKLRLRSDAIIVGAETVRTDDPKLTLRGPGKKPGKMQPWRVVLTRSGDLPPDAALFTDVFSDRTLVFKRRSLLHVLKALAKKGAMTVMIEGGSTVLTQAFSHGLVDELCFYMAPIISGTGKPVIDPGIFRGNSKTVENITVRRIADDIRIAGLMAKGTTE